MLTTLHELLALVLRCIALPFLPNTWRAVFLRKVKVRIYLDSGQHIDVLCESWNVTVGKNASYKFTGMYSEVLIDPARIVAVQKRR